MKAIKGLVLLGLLSASNSALAVLMTIDFSGEANTLGSNSTTMFHGSSIVGSITYESNTAGEDLDAFRRIFRGSIVDFGFTITLADGSEYVSDGLFVNQLGEEIGALEIQRNLPRLDLVSQGIFDGPGFGAAEPRSYFLRLVDGTTVEPFDFLNETDLPDTAFSLGTELESASLRLDWQHPNNTSVLQRFQSFLDVVSVAPAAEAPTPVPEPGALTLLTGGLLVLAVRRRRR